VGRRARCRAGHGRARRGEGPPRVLRLDFPAGGRARNLVRVDWDRWLDAFDERKPVFLFQEHRTDGRTSNFFRLDSPERAAG